MLRVHITGVGDAFTERYHNASLCLEEPDHHFRLMIDCPPAFPRVLADHRRQAGTDLSVENIDHLLLTHLHGDHCGGTESYLYLRRFVVGRLPTLWGAPEVLDALWPTRLRGGMEQLLLAPQPDGPRAQLTLADYTHRGDLLAERTRIGPLLIERRFTIHHIPTTAIRVTVDGQSRPCLGYSADTAFDPDLIEWLAQADLIIHETNYGVHTPLDKLAALPAALRERMRLIHYPDQLDLETAPIRPLRQGEILDLPGALRAPSVVRTEIPASPPEREATGPQQDPLASPALARILDHVAHPIFIKDRSFRFALVNQALADMVRVPRAALLGKSDYDFFPQAEADFFRRKDEQVFSGGAAVVIEEERITDASGQVHVLTTTKVPLLDEAGQVTYMVGITHDISQLKRTEEHLRCANRELGVALTALKRSNARLHELDRLKSELLANVSHEFRTPLTLNLAPLEEMLAAEQTRPDHDRLQHVYRNSLRLLHLVNNLLDYSRLESGRADAAFEPVLVTPLTRQFSGAFAAAFAKKGLGFRFVANTPQEQIAFLDPQLWEKIVFNLLSNALKFTDRGEVVVTLSLISQDSGALSDPGDDPQRLRLEVADTGIGVPPEERAAVFERFHRAHPTGGQGGTGIGLSLVAEAVRLHGGAVELAEAPPGAGSRFIVELPVGSAHLRQDQLRQGSPCPSPPPSVRTPELGWSTPALQDAPPPDAADPDAPLILIIDDNVEMRTYLGALLCGLGRVLIAADGQAGLRLSRDRRPDLILADVMMPIIDGFELCRLLREDATLCGVPIMLLTARAELASRVKGLRSGADDYVLKPFSPEELLARARLQLNLRSARLQLQAHAHHLEQLLNDKIGEVRRRHAELHTIVGNLGEGVLVFDSAERLTLVNMAATALTGLSLAQGTTDQRGASVESVIRGVPMCDAEGHLVSDSPGHPLRRAFAGESVRDMEVRLVPRGDQDPATLDAWVLLCATPLPDRAGVVCTLHDIHRLKEAERLKDEFLSVASHELRTPLSSLQLLAGVFRAQVKGQPYAEPLLPLLDRQQRLIHRLGRLIADILDVSRLQLGRMSVQKRPVGLLPLLRDAIDRARATFGARHTIVLHMLQEVCVRADPDRLDQVLSNLLANACKYAPAGTEIAVDIAVDLAREVSISVCDRGPGIPKEMQERVFERFYQVEAASGRAFGGLGLGLYISRELVIAHGGRIWIESEPGQGCVFRFTLPME